MEHAGWQNEYDRVKSLVERHETWRGSCLNLCAAENAMSPAVRGMLCTDLAQRYGDYTGRDLHARRYFGTREIAELEATVSQLAADVFDARYVELRPISGHIAGNAVMMGFCKAGDVVFELGSYSGGHRLATKLAAGGPVSLQVEYLPFDPVAFNVDVPRTLEMVRRFRPRLIVLGSSNFLFPHPVRELAEGLREFPETILSYDASHVLGLIAGRRFQDPLGEGAQLVFGGTQKSFPGPQGGVIYGNSPELMEVMGSNVHPVLVSNHHLARLPSLGLALVEMKEWGAAYADQVIRNARALGSALAALDVPVVAAESGFTASHTVLLSTALIDSAAVLGQRLDDANIIVTAVRLPKELGAEGLRIGVNEITRRAADERSMEEVARLIAAVVLGSRPVEHIRGEVQELTRQLQGYCFTFS